MGSANPQFIGGFDATVNGLTVRDNTGWLDQNGRHIHPGVNPSPGFRQSQPTGSGQAWRRCLQKACPRIRNLLY